MILITGTNLTVGELPNSDMIDYQVENQAKMNIKLRTVAKAATCFKVYISEEDRVKYTITEEVATKVIYFKNDAELLQLLGKSVEAEVPEESKEEVEEPKVEVPIFEKPEVVEEEKPKEVEEENIGEGTDESQKEVKVIKPIEEADTEAPDDFFVIPDFEENLDSFKLQLKHKDDVIAQKESMLKEVKQTIDEIYIEQEKELTEVTDLCNAKLAEAQEVITKLSNQPSVTLDAEETQFLQYRNYAKTYKGIVQDTFTEEEFGEIGKVDSNITILAAGSGESTHIMLKYVKELIDSNKEVLIVDFTNESYLTSMLKLPTKDKHSMKLNEQDTKVKDLITKVASANVIGTTIYNDIALLDMDWVQVIKKLVTLAKDRDILLLFGNVGTFSVRHTVNKLSKLGKLRILAKCSPIVLTDLYSTTRLMPRNNVSIVAMEYIEQVKPLLDTLAQVYNTQAYNGSLDWNKVME